MGRGVGPDDATLRRAAAYFFLFETVSAAKERARLWARLAPGVHDDSFDGFDRVAADLLDRSALAVHRQREETAERLYRAMSSNPTFSVVERGSPHYPARLAVLDEAPPFITADGDVDVLARPTVAIVGTRQPSSAGMQRARYLAYQLARRQVVVASGLARGIDEAAHTGALHAGGVTVAVLGTPVDRTYPREHAVLQGRIAETGALVSQFPPGMRVQRHFFPMRNAVMSGLSLATVVVEASETSGALIQARACLRQGRKLFIPRSATLRPDLGWPAKFAEQGARVFDSVDQVLEELNVHGIVQEPTAVHLGHTRE